MKIIRESNGLLTVTDEKKLYSLQCGNVVVIAEQRIKSAQVYFWSEEDWAKMVAKEKKRLEREIKKATTVSSKQKGET